MSAVPGYQHQSIFEKLLGYVKKAGEIAGLIPESHFQLLSQVIDIVETDLLTGSGPSAAFKTAIIPSDPGNPVDVLRGQTKANRGNGMPSVKVPKPRVRKKKVPTARKEPLAQKDAQPGTQGDS